MYLYDYDYYYYYYYYYNHHHHHHQQQHYQRHEVTHLTEALRYNPEGRGFDSRWCH